ncbi:MAG: hypothetical protein JWQ48_3196 [Conexibacter sp.]|jgi:hypothetical protein|nr:hypothetical protein [Conexibacter sp.]
MRKLMVGVLGVATLIAGCGSSSDYQNKPRPPALANVTVNVTNARVSVSPSHIGAGPVVLIVSNVSSGSRDLTLVAPEGSDSSCVDASASSGPINPQGTARLPLELVEGDCIVSVRGERRTRPARLTVSRERESAQSDLLQP